MSRLSCACACVCSKTASKSPRLAPTTKSRPSLALADANSTRNNAFCVSDALTTIQNDTDTNVSFDTVTALLGGDNSTEEKLVQAFGTGNLCTGCVAE